MRLIILLSYVSFFSYLHISGELSKYINMKYSYISFIGIFLLSILTLSHLFSIIKQEKNIVSCDCCNHGHHQLKRKDMAYIVSNIIYLLPIITGFSLPVAILDASYAENRGMNLVATNQDNSNQNIESFYEDFKKDKVILTDENFIVMSERVYSNIDKFDKKEIEYTGTVFTREALNGKKTFAVRFGIAHCIADSGTYGFLLELSDDMIVKPDDWVHIKGVINKVYDEELLDYTPVVTVGSLEYVEQPLMPYVYFETN